MRVIKPDSLALTYKNFSTRKEKMLSVGMMSCFHFNRGGVDNLMPEEKLWELSGLAMGSHTVLDEGFPKPASEFLVYGFAHAGRNKKCTSIEIAVHFDRIEKSLSVFGDRYFDCGKISFPQSFETISIDEYHAFGGMTYTENPMGKGMSKIVVDGIERHVLPNVELSDCLIMHVDDRPLPASLSALNSGAPQRTCLLGTFDNTWLKTRWPSFPDDMDVNYYHVAPVDQRIDGFFYGDEKFSISNMHPDFSLLGGELPRLRARCFVHQILPKDKNAGFKELSTHAETVWLFPDYECGIILYRAEVHTNDSNAEDVLHVMAQWENLDDAPSSYENYRELFFQSSSKRK